MKQALALAPDGTLYLSGGNRVRAVSPSGVITTVAGNGQNPGICKLTNGTIATHVAVGSPGIAVSPTDRLYLALGCPSDFYLSTSFRTSGLNSAILISVFAAPDGSRLPCSHCSRVRRETPSSAANRACESPVLTLALATAVFGSTT